MESSDLFSHRPVVQPTAPRDAVEEGVQYPVFSDGPSQAGSADSPPS